MTLIPEQRQKVYDFWKRVYEECAPGITRSTVSIYGYQDKEVKQNGTGVLLQIGEKHFLLSAAHVLDFAAIHNIPYCLSPAVQGEEAVPLNKVRVVTSPVPAGRDKKDIQMRDDDPFDIGFIELSQQMVEKLLPTRRFASLSEVDIDPMQERGCYLVLGYPFEFSYPDMRNKRVYYKPLRYVTELCDYSSNPVNQDVVILLRYPAHGIDSIGNEVKVPNPKGISGCGIWRLAEMKRPDQWTPADCKLVGIEHMWGGAKRYIKGTRVKHVLQLIYRCYPSLRATMDLHLGLATAGW